MIFIFNNYNNYNYYNSELEIKFIDHLTVLFGEKCEIWFRVHTNYFGFWLTSIKRIMSFFRPLKSVKGGLDYVHQES